MKLPSLCTKSFVARNSRGIILSLSLRHCDIVDVLKHQDHHFRSHKTVNINHNHTHRRICFLCIFSLPLFEPCKWKFEFRFARLLQKLWKNNLFATCSASVGSLESYVACIAQRCTSTSLCRNNPWYWNLFNTMCMQCMCDMFKLPSLFICIVVWHTTQTVLIENIIALRVKRQEINFTLLSSANWDIKKSYSFLWAKKIAHNRHNRTTI